MKIKWLFQFLLGFLLLGYSETWGADWKYFGQTQLASYFYDDESIIHEENIVRVWLKAVYSEEGRLDEVKKLGGEYWNLTDSIALEEIYCKDRRHRVLMLIVYFMEGQAIISDIRRKERGFMIPGSILESLYKGVCK